MSDIDKNAHLPNPEKLKEQISAHHDGGKSPQSRFERRFEQDSVKIQAEYTHLSGLQDHYKQKNRWSYFLIALLFSMVVFQSVLLRNVGLGTWDFQAYDWLLPVLLFQNLGQIISLAFIIVKSLFK